MKKTPYFEDLIRFYFHYSMRHLFPKKTKNKLIVYIIGIFHLLGAIILQYAPYFLIPSLLLYYIIFVTVNLLGYYIFNDQCFMTLLSNYYGNIEGQPLKVRWKTFKNALFFNLLISIIGFICPFLAPINWFNIITSI